MNLRRIIHDFTVILLATLALLGCVDDELDAVTDITVATHVEDWRDEIIYQLMTDRFANGSAANDYRVNPNPNALAAYQGGDWLGIIDQLDYLEELGVTALWISPIVRNVETDAGVDGYHGYWAVDLESLNPHFGDLATLRRLVQECHARGMKVIVDIVTNHLGQVFYYDINLNGEPNEAVYGGYPTEPGNPMGGSRTPVTRLTEYDPDYDPRGIQAFTSLGEAGPAPIEFFNMPSISRIAPLPAIFQSPEAYHRRGRVIDWNSREQVMFGDFPGGLKDLNTENPQVVEALIAAYVRWVELTDIDGFRIDTIKHVDYAFWETFSGEVRERLAALGKDRFMLFGEAFDGDDALVGSYTQPGMLDSVFYFPQKWQVFNDIFGQGGPTRNMETLFQNRMINYGSEAQPGGIGLTPQQALIGFIDNHDVPRFLYEVGDPAALRAALGLLMTEDGIPCIYYGTEQDFDGGNDPANREPLWWSGYRTDGLTFRWISDLSRLRREVVALRRGDLGFVWTTDRVGDEQDAGILAFERSTPDGDYALVVLNTQGRKVSETSATSLGGDAMRVNAGAGTELVDVISGERFTVDSGQSLTVRVAPFGMRVLVPATQCPGGDCDLGITPPF